MASIHPVNNLKATEDAIYKVRPISSALNDFDKMLPYTQLVLDDESMIAYYSKSVCKQLIRGKPIQFGFEVCSQASPSW